MGDHELGEDSALLFETKEKITRGYNKIVSPVEGSNGLFLEILSSFDPRRFPKNLPCFHQKNKWGSRFQYTKDSQSLYRNSSFLSVPIAIKN